MMPLLANARQTPPRPRWSSERARRSGCENGAHPGRTGCESSTSARSMRKCPRPPPGCGTGASPGRRAGSAHRRACRSAHPFANLRRQAHPEPVLPRSATTQAPPCASWPRRVGTGATTTTRWAHRPAPPRASVPLATRPAPGPATRPRTAPRARATGQRREGAPKARRQHQTADAR